MRLRSRLHDLGRGRLRRPARTRRRRAHPELDRTLATYRLVWNIDALTYEYRTGGDSFDAYRNGITTALAELN